MKKKVSVARPQKKSGKKISRDIIPADNYGKVVSALVENAESQLAMLEQQGKIVEKFAYSFPGRNGQKIEGLTYWGLLACATSPKKTGYQPVFGKPEYTSAGDKILLTVSVKNPKTGQTEWGTCAFDPRERFAERIALTNAKRYALDKLISIPQKLAFLEYIKKQDTSKILTITPPKTTTEVRRVLNPSQDDSYDKALRAVYAKINDLLLPTEKTMEYFKNLYGVDSVKKLSVEQLRQIWKELRSAEVDTTGGILCMIKDAIKNMEVK